MKHVCIINYSSVASEYGIGTFLHEFTKFFKNEAEVTIVNIGVDCKNDLMNIKHDRARRIHAINIPQKYSSNIDNTNKGVNRILRLFIEDSTNLIFHFNYFQSESLIKNIKEYFPLAHCVFTIHYLHWSGFFNGKILKYLNIIEKHKNRKINEKYKDIINFYELEKRVFDLMDAVVCLSNDTYNLLDDYYLVDHQKLHLIPNGLSPKRMLNNAEKTKIRERFGFGKSDKILLFVGRICEIKGIKAMMEAFSKVNNHIPNTKLVIVGEGNYNEIFDNCNKTWSNVIMTGKLKRRTLDDWYNIADIGIFPSYYEECSYVGIEMKMYGLPVIASDAYSVKNMFDESNAEIAITGNQYNTKEFASNLENSMSMLLSSINVAENKRFLSRRSYNKIYKLKYMKLKYKSLYINITR